MGSGLTFANPPVAPNASAYFGVPPGFWGVLGVPLGGAVLTGVCPGVAGFGDWRGLVVWPGLTG